MESNAAIPNQTNGMGNRINTTPANIIRRAFYGCPGQGLFYGYRFANLAKFTKQ